MMHAPSLFHALVLTLPLSFLEEASQDHQGLE